MRGAWRLVVLLAALAGPLAAQQAAQPAGPGPDPAGLILTLDRERLFAQSRFGLDSLARELAASRALEAENNRIEAELIAEEQDLTDRRATLAPEEFSALASAFDARVERIRAEQDQKLRALTRARDEDRRYFQRAVIPVLGEILTEKRAAAILDTATVILSLSALDITDEAIARVDQVLAATAPPPP